jgi:hypothetical protein
MRFPRMTTRRWMLAVLVVGLLCLLEHRRREFESLAAYHGSKVIRIVVRYQSTDGTWYWKHRGTFLTRAQVEEADWHAALAERYGHAARYPWLPVEPDPPPPE